MVTNFLGLLHQTAINSASNTISFVILDCIDQPMTLRENRCTATAN